MLALSNIMYSSDALQISCYFRFRHILLRLSRCRRNALGFIHTLPMSSRLIRKTLRKCASLLTPPPCFARRHRHHRLLFRHCNEDYPSSARNFAHQMLNIQDSCNSSLPEELDFGSEGRDAGRRLKEYCVAHLSSSSDCQLVLKDNGNVVAAVAALMDSNVAGHEINENFNWQFPARLTPRDCSNRDPTNDLNVAGRDINENADALQFDEVIKMRACSANISQIISDAASAVANGFNVTENEIRFIENVRLKDYTEDVSQSSECLALENSGDADLNFPGDEINIKADAFIARFREHIRLERRNSDLRYLERLHRSVA